MATVVRVRDGVASSVRHPVTNIGTPLVAGELLEVTDPVVYATLWAFETVDERTPLLDLGSRHAIVREAKAAHQAQTGGVVVEDASAEPGRKRNLS